MKLTIDFADFERIDEKSTYNHNYYKYVGKSNLNDTEIYEICHEDYNYSEYYLIENDSKIFLGCAIESNSINKVVNIDFRMFYT